MSESESIAVFMTASTAEEADRLAEMLIEKRLAACVQIIPQMKSVYRWRGNVERSSEILLIAKTVNSRFSELEKEVKALHSYETPEIVALTITAGSSSYLDWLRTSVQENS